MAIKMRFGWVLSGLTAGKRKADQNVCCLSVSSCDEELRQFWEVEVDRFRGRPKQFPSIAKYSNFHYVDAVPELDMHMVQKTASLAVHFLLHAVRSVCVGLGEVLSNSPL